jgi:hypothetical protein
MDQVKINVEDGGLAGFFIDGMVLPYFLDDGFGHVRLVSDEKAGIVSIIF